MKIAIIGNSGSGKSTLARLMSQYHRVPVLHLDTVQFLPDWEIRCQEEKERLVGAFLDSHDQWVIDGNYSQLHYERRMQEADEIIVMLFPRFACLFRAFARYRKYKNTTRPDMAEGCREKYDWEFVQWILWKGRGPQARARYRSVIGRYGEKTVVLRSQKQLDRYIGALGTGEKVTE